MKTETGYIVDLTLVDLGTVRHLTLFQDRFVTETVSPTLFRSGGVEDKNTVRPEEEREGTGDQVYKGRGQEPYVSRRSTMPFIVTSSTTFSVALRFFRHSFCLSTLHPVAHLGGRIHGPS